MSSLSANYSFYCQVESGLVLSSDPGQLSAGSCFGWTTGMSSFAFGSCVLTVYGKISLKGWQFKTVASDFAIAVYADTLAGCRNERAFSDAGFAGRYVRGSRRRRGFVPGAGRFAKIGSGTVRLRL